MRNQSIRTSFSTCYQDSSQLTSFTNNRAFNKKVVLTENMKNSEKNNQPIQSEITKKSTKFSQNKNFIQFNSKNSVIAIVINNSAETLVCIIIKIINPIIFYQLPFFKLITFFICKNSFTSCFQHSTVLII